MPRLFLNVARRDILPVRKIVSQFQDITQDDVNTQWILTHMNLYPLVYASYQHQARFPLAMDNYLSTDGEETLPQNLRDVTKFVTTIMGGEDHYLVVESQKDSKHRVYFNDNEFKKSVRAFESGKLEETIGFLNTIGIRVPWASARKMNLFDESYKMAGHLHYEENDEDQGIGIEIDIKQLSDTQDVHLLQNLHHILRAYTIIRNHIINPESAANDSEFYTKMNQKIKELSPVTVS